MGLPNYIEAINMRNPLYHDIWAEAVIPGEISLSGIRVASFSSSSNNVQMIKQLDLLEEN